jgi:hypothetical protein
VADHPRADLDWFLAQCRQRSVLGFALERELPEEVTQIVRQDEQLKAYLVVAEILARELRPAQDYLGVFDPLFRCAALIAEVHDSLGSPGRVRDDETHARK